MVTDDHQSETQLLSKVIIELNIARKNVLSYPKGHPLIEATVDKAFNLLKKLISLKNEITIGIAKDALIVGEEYLDKKSPVFKDFASSLYKKGIASVNFTEELNKEDFIKFHELISSEQETDATFKDMVNEVLKTEIKSIKLKVLDYRAFRLIKEERLNAQRKADLLWDAFIRAFLEDTLEFLDYAEEDEEAIELKDMSPAALAEAINQKAEGEITDSVCDKTISKYLGKIGEGREERKINLNRLTEFLDNLKPELKEQFLSSTVKHLSENPHLADDILSEFPEKLIINVLEIINKTDANIPPLILNVLQTLANTGKEESSVKWGRVERETLGDLTEDEIKETLATVFKEDAASPDYRDKLAHLMATAQPPESDEITEQADKALGECNIEEEIINVIFEILEKNIPDEEFSKLVKKTEEMSAFFLETGQFNALLKIYDTLGHHATSENEMRSNAANSVIQSFSERKYMEEIINGFSLWEKEKHDDISALIRQIGVGFIPVLLDTLSEEKDASKRNFLVELIATFGAAATSEAIIRVEDCDPYFIKKLIIILRQSNDRNLIPVVRRFIKHPDTKVQIEALRTLLYLKAPNTADPLREKITSANNEISKSAIFLAGVYKVSEATDLLMDILRKRLFWSLNFEKKEACVKSLGEIGDQAVLPELSKVLKAKSLLKRKTLAKLKMSIIQSMEKYPLDETAAFLETQAGSVKLRNKELQKAYSEMLNKIMKKKANLNG